MKNEVLKIIKKFDRINFCHRPTPLEYCRNISHLLGGPDIWIKRDDCTGLATGGNKTRKLEFLMGDALAQDSSVIVTQGAVQSNHVRQTAAASCLLGLESYALLERRVKDSSKNYEKSGNVFYNKIFGTKIDYRPPGLDMNDEACQLVKELKRKGKKPYFIPGGGSNEIGGMGYVDCALEISKQIEDLKIDVQCIILATGSTGTQAGMVAGLNAINIDIPVIGISVRQPKQRQIDSVYNLAEKINSILQGPKLNKNKIIVYDEYVGPGYGIPTKGTIDATSFLARNEGILLDLVYSGKAMDGLIDMIKKHNFKKDKGDIIFLHTGGSSSLFAYEEYFEK